MRRKDVKKEDTWDLSSLYTNDDVWEKSFLAWTKRLSGYKKFMGTLSRGPKYLLECLEFNNNIERDAENLGNYAFLRSTEDESNTFYLSMKGRFENASAKQTELSSFIRPEILSMPDKKLSTFLKSPILKDWKLFLERIIRLKPHSLSSSEESLLAMHTQIYSGPSNIFGQLNNVDFKWGSVKDENGIEVAVNHSTFSELLQSKDRNIRKNAFHEYYSEFEKHQNTISATYNSSVLIDSVYAKIRKHKSAFQSAMFNENMKVSVYKNLIETVHKMLPDLYRYLEIRKRVLGLKDLHQYDVYNSIIPEISNNRTFDEAVKLTLESVKPLGEEYVSILKKGLVSDRWCDKYPNENKHSGAFSSGSYDSKPYILMNYSEKILDHVFTLAHEAGHSMHSYLSCKNQPYQYSGYTIFTAEVASTFNEQLLLDSMLKKANRKEKIELLNHAINAVRTTIIRQVMFAEYEKKTHEIVESGEPLTATVLRREYRKLLELYFGPKFIIDDQLELECLRIPHFYRSFYVYKYATGLISAIVLSNNILTSDSKTAENNREAYLNMLKSGGNDWALNLLKKAGVDLTKKESIQSVISYFKKLIDELDELV